MQANQCPQCSAQLPPGAQKCNFCGLLTPWGATLAAQQQQSAQIQAEHDKRIRVTKAVSTARTGMILALVGLPICCGPLSLVGGAIGYRGARLARAEGLPRPVTSVIAMVVALLSTAAFCTGIVMFVRDQQQKAAQTEQVEARLRGKRDAAVLEPRVACDLAEEYLLQHGYGGKTLDFKEIHCDGAVTVDDRRAQAVDVRFAFGETHSTVTACFERRSRWFVLDLLDGGTCAELPPPAPFTAPPRQLGDAELAADEKKTRDDIGRAAGALVVSAFTRKLAQVRASSLDPAGPEKECASADLAAFVTKGNRLEVPTFDPYLLDPNNAAGTTKAWSMMTSAALRTILDEKGKPDARAKSIQALRANSGPLLVVYRTERRLWPVANGKSDLIGKDFSYEGGEFDGTLMIYNIDSGQRLCETKLLFESSDAVNFKKSRFSSEKTKAKEAIEADFKNQFETAATEAIKRIAPDLRLSYKVSE